ncbi:MAG: hypothetical protein LBH13_06980 [Cellulomonadaceae bacterium]|jgi:hypothetical protein|nr:hypothetical protein [Cellulomonadaceae bacterium]
MTTATIILTRKQSFQVVMMTAAVCAPAAMGVMGTFSSLARAIGVA